MKNFKILEYESEDNYTITYTAYDLIKKTYCYIIFPKRTTSWQYSVYY
jgi:hypothetical protein